MQQTPEKVLDQCGAFGGHPGVFGRGERECFQYGHRLGLPRRCGGHVREEVVDQFGPVGDTFGGESEERFQEPRRPVEDEAPRPRHGQRDEFRGEGVRAQPLQEVGPRCSTQHPRGPLPVVGTVEQPGQYELLRGRQRTAGVVDEVFGERVHRVRGRRPFAEQCGQLGPPCDGMQFQDVHRPGVHLEVPVGQEPGGRGFGGDLTPQFGGEQGGLHLRGEFTPGHAPAVGRQFDGTCPTLGRRQRGQFPDDSRDVAGLHKFDQLRV
ncbi:hypothetical protein GCM10017557_12980 [Streptomyces aurantiacus]|uniref:Uncharacterized protein n=1 Tax=Streptomyces aurantiacus TaxID=47760 RepID=A0A7G1NUB1_9ACTN|nr:hypothetical protein GCM10017557_12980 [Streptomyces aurantiacus]